jgi:hypothetical protein
MLTGGDVAMVEMEEVGFSVGRQRKLSILGQARLAIYWHYAAEIRPSAECAAAELT